MASPETPSILPPPQPELFPVAFSISQEDVDWMTAQATRLNTNRSRLLRDIIANLREQQEGLKSA